MSQNLYIRASVLMASLAIVSRLLGIGRDVVIAWQFGLSKETDAFFVAFSIPYAFYSIFGASLVSVIVPLLSKFEAGKDFETKFQIVSLVLNVVVVFSLIVAAVFMLASDSIAWAIGGGFDKATLKLASDLIVFVMPSILFMNVAGVLSGFLNSNQIFAPTAVGPVLMNLLIIVIGLACSGFFGIHSFVFGAVFGSMALFFVHLSAICQMGYRHQFSLKFEFIDSKQIFSLLLPVVLISCCGFCFAFIDFRVGSGMVEGSIAALNYANKLVQLPQALFVAAIYTAIFPDLSKAAACSRLDDMTFLLNKGLRSVLILVTPSVVFLIFLGNLLIKLIFQNGKFTDYAVLMTNDALNYLSFSIVGSSVVMILIRAYYALNERYLPLLIAVGAVFLKLLLSLFFIKYEYKGLALSTSVSLTCYAFFLLFFLRNKLEGLLDLRFLLFILKLFLSSCLLACMLYVSTQCNLFNFSGTKIGLLAEIFVQFIVGGGVYLSVLFLLKVEEIFYILSSIKRKMSFKYKVGE